MESVDKHFERVGICGLKEGGVVADLVEKIITESFGERFSWRWIWDVLIQRWSWKEVSTCRRLAVAILRLKWWI
jgi:hypothetical protein